MSTAAKKKYPMPYIADKQVYKAVQFARALRKTMGTGLAVHRAAKYYGVSESKVASYLGKMGGGAKTAEDWKVA